MLAFVGAWIFSFTTDRENSDRKKLTPAGKVALPIAICMLISGFILLILDDKHKADKAEAAKALQQKTGQIIALASLPQSVARDKQLQNLLHSTGITEASTLTPELTRTTAMLIEE